MVAIADLGFAGRFYHYRYRSGVDCSGINSVNVSVRKVFSCTLHTFATAATIPRKDLQREERTNFATGGRKKSEILGVAAERQSSVSQSSGSGVQRGAVL